MQVTDANNDSALSTMMLASTPQPPTAATGAAPATATGATLPGDATANGSATPAYFEYGDLNLLRLADIRSSGRQRLDCAVGERRPVKSTAEHDLPLPARCDKRERHELRHRPLIHGAVAADVCGDRNCIQSPTVVRDAQRHHNPAGLETTYYFNYGVTSSYGSSTPSADAGEGTSTESLSATVAGLQGNTTYHFEIVAVNESGTFYGPDQTLTTAPLPTSTASSPVVTNQTTFAVSYTAAGSPGGPQLAQVVLYAQAPGQSGYTKVATNTGSAEGVRITV